MKPKSLNEIIFFGGQIAFLKNCRVGQSVHVKGGILANLNLFLDFIKTSEFKVTKIGVGSLKIIHDILSEKPEDYKLSLEDQKELFKVMDKLWFLIDTEGKTLFSYFLIEKKIDNEKLLNVASLFARDVYNSLSDAIQYDFSEGGKCIAFECSTAGAYHVLRGLEGLLRLLLGKLDSSLDTSTMAWGPVISNLRTLSIPNLTTLLDNCDRIRANYRNPTNHPEKIYSINEVQNLFNLCVGIVDDIIAYMKGNNLL